MKIMEMQSTNIAIDVKQLAKSLGIKAGIYSGRANDSDPTYFVCRYGKSGEFCLFMQHMRDPIGIHTYVRRLGCLDLESALSAFAAKYPEARNLVINETLNVGLNKLSFGKYKGKTIAEVDSIDPKHIDWLWNQFGSGCGRQSDWTKRCLGWVKRELDSIDRD